MNGKSSFHLGRMKELENVYSRYTGRAGLQRSLTLDEFYYHIDPKSHVLKAKAEDQIIFKWSSEGLKHPQTQKFHCQTDQDQSSQDQLFQQSQKLPTRVPGKTSDKDSRPSSLKKLLMVNQLWMWKLEDGKVSREMEACSLLLIGLKAR